MKSVVNDFQNFMNIYMLYPVRNNDMRVHIEQNFLPTRIEEWYDGNKNTISFRKLLSELRKNWPTNKRRVCISDFISYCKIIYRSVDFKDKGNVYNKLREELIESGSELAKKFLKIERFESKIIDKAEFERAVTYCSDYTKGKNIESHWREVTN
jgi:hypothetical protein